MSFYIPVYEPFKHPKDEVLDESTLVLLQRFDDVATAAGEIFRDMAVLIERLTLEAHRLELRILDHLYSAYSSVLDALQQTLAGCAKYMFCYRRTEESQFEAQVESDILGALADLDDLRKQMQTSVTDVQDRWEELVRDLNADLTLLRPSGLYEWLLDTCDPNCIPARQRALLADLSSLQATAMQNLIRFDETYRELEDSLLAIEAARTSVPEMDAADELGRGLEAVISDLMRLDSIFSDYDKGLSFAKGGIRNWSYERKYNTPIRTLLTVEKDWQFL
ncbi:hypothetical protein B0H19DRAFT_1115605 [Mycena capillaripes]|nr:hypothetical protein B0H19DRAFT_1115605 [Mycena capillaripes]